MSEEKETKAAKDEKDTPEAKEAQASASDKDAGNTQEAQATTESGKSDEAAADSTKEAELKERLHDMGVMPREDEMPEITPRRLTRTIVLGLVALVLVIAGVYWWHERGEPADETASADAQPEAGANTALNGAPVNGGPMMAPWGAPAHPRMQPPPRMPGSAAPPANGGGESAGEAAPAANPPAPPPGWGPPGRMTGRPMPPMAERAPAEDALPSVPPRPDMPPRAWQPAPWPPAAPPTATPPATADNGERTGSESASAAPTTAGEMPPGPPPGWAPPPPPPPAWGYGYPAYGYPGWGAPPPAWGYYPPSAYYPY